MRRKTPIAKVDWKWGNFAPYIWKWRTNKLKTSVNFVNIIEIISISDFFRNEQRKKVGRQPTDTVWWWSFSWSNLCKSRATDNFYSVKFCVQTNHSRSNYKCFSEETSEITGPQTKKIVWQHKVSSCSLCEFQETQRLRCGT